MTNLIKLVLWSCLILTLGYQITKTENIHANKKTPNVPKISINLVQKKRYQNNTIYTFRFRNESKQVIKQCNVYYRYHIITKQGIQKSHFKIEAIGNKLNIKPNEKLTLLVTIPYESVLKGERLNSNYTVLEVIGYVNSVSNGNKFRETVKVEDQ